MGSGTFVSATLLLCLSLGVVVQAGSPRLHLNWAVTYGDVSPLGVKTQGILINGQFPAPRINCTTNDIIVLHITNKLDEPLLLTFNGIQHRKSSWQSGNLGTSCPILPGTSFAYTFQAKDQIGGFFYFPSTALHRAAGGFGAFDIKPRTVIPIPFDEPAKEFNVLAGDWYNAGHKALRKQLDSGRALGTADGMHINGGTIKLGEKKTAFTMEAGKTYKYRVCNVGLRTSFNFWIHNHKLQLVEMEGSYTVQNKYSSIDVHVGQCVAVLVTADQPPKDYYMIVNSRFTKKPMVALATVSYEKSTGIEMPKSINFPVEGKKGIMWSLNQFRSFRWNLTASAARPNPQGSYHYGEINTTRTLKLVNSQERIDGKLRYAINGVSHVDGETPIRLAEYFGVGDKVFKYNLMKDMGDDKVKPIIAPNVVNMTFRDWVEIIFENKEKTIQTWGLKGHSFFPVAMDFGKWTPEKRKNYNLVDAVSRTSIQVYPGSWTTVFTYMDNSGMWNLRSEMMARTYLGQQAYLVQLVDSDKFRETGMPTNATVCGIVKNMPRPAGGQDEELAEAPEAEPKSKEEKKKEKKLKKEKEAAAAAGPVAASDHEEY